MTLFKNTWAAGDGAHATVHNSIADALNNGDVSVKWFGAVGNGSTDDTAAIAAAIAAIPAWGGTLYFPPGTYVTTGGFTIAYPTMIKGCGRDSIITSQSAVTTITCTSATASLFTVTAVNATFRDLSLQNTAASAPTAGAGITNARNERNQCNYENISVVGFYVGIDTQTGTRWKMRDCLIGSPVKYGIKIRNTISADSGDWSIAGTDFVSHLYAADAAIQIETSGGGRISDCKVNDGTNMFTSGIKVAWEAGKVSVILNIQNNSFENVSGNGIDIVINGANSKYRGIAIIGNEFGLWSTIHGHGISISADNIANINGVVITGNTFFGTSTDSAIDLSKVNNVQINDNVYETFGSLLTQANCTNVVVQAA